MAVIPFGAPAEGLRWTRIDGHLELGSEYRRQRSDSPSAEERRYDEIRVEESVGLDVEGFAMKPGLLSFGADGTVGFRQSRRDSTDASFGDDDGRLLEFDADLRLLSDQKLSFLVYGRRSDDDWNRGIGTDTESSSETVGAIARFSWPVFPSSLTWQRQASRAESFGISFSTRRQETRELLEYSGQRIRESGQFRLRLRQEDVDDESFPPIGDYRIREGTASVGRRWGTRRARSWQTSGRYFERKGRFDYESASADTTLGWRLGETLDLGARHQFGRFSSDGAATTTNNGTVTLEHRLYESLKTQLRGFGSDVDQVNGNRTGYGGDVGLRYRKSLPWASELRLDTRVRWERDNNDLDSRESPVTGESLTIAATGTNLLAEPFVDPLSIRVTEGANGPLLFEGIDYTVQVIGTRTSIEALPGGALAAGSVVVVDYVRAVDPSAEIDTTGFRFGAAWERGWFRIRYEHDQREERQRSGAPARLLQDSHRDRVQVELRRDGRELRSRIAAAVATDRSVSVAYDEWSITHSTTWSPAKGIDLNLHLRGGERAFSRPERDTSHFNANASFAFRPRRDQRIRLYAEYRRFDDSISPNQRDFEVGVRGRFRYALIELTPLLSWTQSERGQSTVDDLHVLLRVRRNF